MGGCCGSLVSLDKNLDGQVVIITGANTGIGLETARALAHCGATLVLACRSLQRTQPILTELQKQYGEKKILFIPLDLTDLASVKSFVTAFLEKFTRLDILINNAGVMAIPERQETRQGFEMQFGTNHIGHFALTAGLLRVLKSTPNSRVVCVSSMAHKSMCMLSGSGRIHFDNINFVKNYDPWVVYSQSKLANVMFAKELNRRFESENVSCKVVSLHPGVVATELQRHQGCCMNCLKCCFISPVQGAQTTLHCALLDFDKLKGGAYFSSCQEESSSNESNNEQHQKQLWTLTEDLIKEAKFEF